jgi:hypothetical protein
MNFCQNSIFAKLVISLNGGMRIIAYGLLTAIPYIINNKNDRKQLIKKAQNFKKITVRNALNEQKALDHAFFQ